MIRLDTTLPTGSRQATTTTTTITGTHLGVLDKFSLCHRVFHGLHGGEVVVDSLALSFASSSGGVAAAETEL